MRFLESVQICDLRMAESPHTEICPTEFRLNGLRRVILVPVLVDEGVFTEAVSYVEPHEIGTRVLEINELDWGVSGAETYPIIYIFQ